MGRVIRVRASSRQVQFGPAGWRAGRQADDACGRPLASRRFLFVPPFLVSTLPEFHLKSLAEKGKEDTSNFKCRVSCSPSLALESLFAGPSCGSLSLSCSNAPTAQFWTEETPKREKGKKISGAALALGRLSLSVCLASANQQQQEGNRTSSLSCDKRRRRAPARIHPVLLLQSWRGSRGQTVVDGGHFRGPAADSAWGEKTPR